jgi:hypothetical protein
MSTTETPAVTLDAEVLPLADYRAIREGKELPKIETPSAADAVKADAETAAVTETVETNLEEPGKAKPKGGKLNARFSELTAKIKTLETQLAGAKPGTGPTETPKIDAPVVVAPDPKDPEPDAAKFGDYVEWQKAWNRWDRRQETRQEKAQAAAAEQHNAVKAKAESWQSRVSEAAAELADFAEVAQNPDLPVSQVMAEAITDSEIGPKILYHLGQNPEDAARIAKLSPVAQVREIGKIEAKLAVDTPEADEETPEPLVKKPLAVSKAPAPHRPLAGAAAVSASKQIDTMTQAEYRAYREAGKIR